jgi:hypothetical protein
VIVLDENVAENERLLLRRWRVPARQIGPDLGRKGLKDSEIIRLLHDLRRATFFTQDLGFYQRTLCHQGYGIVALDTLDDEVASFVRRFLKHPLFGTQAKRLGVVARVSPAGIRLWRLHSGHEEAMSWPD